MLNGPNTEKKLGKLQYDLEYCQEKKFLITKSCYYVSHEDHRFTYEF